MLEAVRGPDMPDKNEAGASGDESGEVANGEDWYAQTECMSAGGPNGWE